MKIKIFTTGGTIDKIYFDSKSAFEVGDSSIHELLRMANVSVEFEVESVFRKDSLDITPADRELILKRVQDEASGRIIITHGTDTMIETAKLLEQVKGKTIVLTGSMQPARFRESDASFNIGSAFSAVQVLSAGVYMALNGKIFSPKRVRKNAQLNRFEEIG